MLRKLQQKLNDLRHAQKGSVMIMVAGGALLVVAATGIAVDTARAMILQTKMSSALDAAGLAAGASTSSNPTGTTQADWVQQQAQKYFDANFPSGYMGSSAVTVTATLSSDKSTVTLNATTSEATTFIAVVGVKSVAVAANSTIVRSSTGMELVLVLDNTGSMANPVNANETTAKIDALKTAVNGSGGLLDILYGSATSIPDLWVGVVPFTDMVNVGTNHPEWIDPASAHDFGPVVGSSCPAYTGTPAATATHKSSPNRCIYKETGSSSVQTNWGTGQWAGCFTSRSVSTASVTEPTLNMDGSDDFPSASTTGSYFDNFYYPSTDNSLSSNACTNGSNPWRCYATSGLGSSKTVSTLYYPVSAASGPNLGCIATQVLPMTSLKSDVSDRVTSMIASGSTMINLGLSWGFRMLSPNWQGKWGGTMDNTGNKTFPKLPLAYNTPLMNKVVILMTDGMNSTNSNSAYIGQTTPSNTTLDTYTLNLCTAMKAHGIIIYTIGFGSGSDVNTTLLSQCATDAQHYFLAPTNADLSAAFSTIGDSLANLRVSK